MVTKDTPYWTRLLNGCVQISFTRPHFLLAVLSTKACLLKHRTRLTFSELRLSAGVWKEEVSSNCWKSFSESPWFPTKTSMKQECSLPMSIPLITVGSASSKTTKALFSPWSRHFHGCFDPAWNVMSERLRSTCQNHDEIKQCKFQLIDSVLPVANWMPDISENTKWLDSVMTWNHSTHLLRATDCMSECAQAWFAALWPK